jgi:hypothetical protein
MNNLPTTSEPAVPKPVAPKDKLLAYMMAQTFEWFAADAGHYGALLRRRFTETRLPPAVQYAANMFAETINILALVSEEDPDTVAVMPALARLVNHSPRLQLRILRDDDDLAPLTILTPELDLTTVLDEWDLPQFLFFDEDWELQGQWGPRPVAAESQLETWLADHPDYATLAEDETPGAQQQYAALMHELVHTMRIWYNSGLTKACFNEWHNLLRTMQTGDDAVGAESEAS